MASMMFSRDLNHLPPLSFLVLRFQMMGYLLIVSVTADIVSFSPKLEPVDVPELLQ